MIRIALIATALLAAPAASAQSQLDLSVQNALKEYGFRNVDVGTLTIAQRAAIHHIAHQTGGGAKRSLIRSALNEDNLRSLITSR